MSVFELNRSEPKAMQYVRPAWLDTAGWPLSGLADEGEHRPGAPGGPQSGAALQHQAAPLRAAKRPRIESPETAGPSADAVQVPDVPNDTNSAVALLYTGTSMWRCIPGASSHPEPIPDVLGSDHDVSVSDAFQDSLEEESIADALGSGVSPQRGPCANPYCHFVEHSRAGLGRSTTHNYEIPAHFCCCKCWTWMTMDYKRKTPKTHGIRCEKVEHTQELRAKAS